MRVLYIASHAPRQESLELEREITELQGHFAEASISPPYFAFYADTTRADRAIGPAGLLASGWIVLDVAGAFAVYAVQGGWAALVGAHRLRRRLES